MSTFAKFVCVIVDAYSTGKFLAPALKAYGIDCIHIKSSAQLPNQFKHCEYDYVRNLVYTEDLEILLSALAPFKIGFCIPGYESGVILADVLSEKLGLPTNKSLYSQARRDKNIMNKMVSKAGLKTIEQLKSDNLDRILKWAEKINLESTPIVLKPLESANGDGVSFCHNSHEIKQAFEKIMVSPNQFGQKNTAVLAEKLNVGQEYIINSVSWEKNHYIVEIWRITRHPFSTIYDTAEIVSPHEAEWEALTLYTKKVLDALFIQYGASTTEVKYTREEGPVLLEVSARLMAGAPLSFSYFIMGVTQLSLLIEAYLFPDYFLKRFEEERNFLEVTGLGVILISNYEGKLKNNINTSVIDNLLNLYSYHVKGAGEYLHKTVDSLTAPGEVFLMGNQKNSVFEDYYQIRSAEKKGLYLNAL